MNLLSCVQSELTIKTSFCKWLFRSRIDVIKKILFMIHGFEMQRGVKKSFIIQIMGGRINNGWKLDENP